MGVFNQPRRWLQRQREAFFTLSPAEKHLAAAAAEDKSTRDSEFVDEKS